MLVLPSPKRRLKVGKRKKVPAKPLKVSPLVALDHNASTRNVKKSALKPKRVSPRMSRAGVQDYTENIPGMNGPAWKFEMDLQDPANRDLRTGIGFSLTVPRIAKARAALPSNVQPPRRFSAFRRYNQKMSLREVRRKLLRLPRFEASVRERLVKGSQTHWKFKRYFDFLKRHKRVGKFSRDVAGFRIYIYIFPKSYSKRSFDLWLDARSLESRSLSPTIQLDMDMVERAKNVMSNEQMSNYLSLFM